MSVFTFMHKDVPVFGCAVLLLGLFSSGCVTKWFGPVKYLYSNGLDESLVSKIVEETSLSVFR